MIPTSGSSSADWGDFFVTTVHNDTGKSLFLTEIGFPCGGPATSEVGWAVWTSVGGPVAPESSPDHADFSGDFFPAAPLSETGVPTAYTYINISDLEIVIPDGGHFCFGYQNPGVRGLAGRSDNCPAWYWQGGSWIADDSAQTTILQIGAKFETTRSTARPTWGSLKAMYH